MLWQDIISTSDITKLDIITVLAKIIVYKS